MEKVLFNKDLFFHITNFISKIYCIHLNSICNDINKFYSCNGCEICKNKLSIPIEIENKLYCYDCIEIDNLKFNKKKFYIDKSDKQKWEYLDSCKYKNYISCKYCKLRCSSYDFAHYHLIYKCKNYFYYQCYIYKN